MSLEQPLRSDHFSQSQPYIEGNEGTKSAISQPMRVPPHQINTVDSVRLDSLPGKSGSLLVVETDYKKKREKNGTKLPEIKIPKDLGRLSKASANLLLPVLRSSS